MLLFIYWFERYIYKFNYYSFIFFGLHIYVCLFILLYLLNNVIIMGFYILLYIIIYNYIEI